MAAAAAALAPTFDSGPMVAPLARLVRLARAHGTPGVPRVDVDWPEHRALAPLLPLADRARGLVETLARLPEPLLRQQVRPHALAEHVYLSNQIEGVGLGRSATLEMAAQVLQGAFERRMRTEVPAAAAAADSRVAPSDCHRELQVVNLVLLLQDAYVPGGIGEQLSNGELEPLLLRWHAALMHGLPEPAGFREDGRRSAPRAVRGGAEHTVVYPHHAAVPSLIKLLALALARFVQQFRLGGAADAAGFLNAFVLAAFAQYHFVRIHPFGDGNGRLSRLLGKLVLDAVLPVPLRMYDDRERYLDTLLECDERAEVSVRNACVPLVKLTLEATVAHFADVVRGCHHATERPVLCMLECLEADELMRKLHRLAVEQTLEEGDHAAVLAAFQRLGDNEAVHVPVRGGTCAVHVARSVDFAAL